MTLSRYQRSNIPGWVREMVEGDLLAPIFESVTQRKWYPEVDIYETGNVLYLEAELPGMKKEDVKVEYQEGIVTISGERKEEETEEGRGYFSKERRYGSFARSFRIGDSYEVDRVKASYHDGVLKLEIPKKQETKPLNIPIG